MVPLFPCAPALSERCTVVDTVPKRSSTALYSPIRARDQKCLLGVSAREETACSTCEPPVTGKSVGRVYRLIDLVSSSSIDDTLSVFAESVFLERSFFSYRLPSDPLILCFQPHKFTPPFSRGAPPSRRCAFPLTRMVTRSSPPP